MKRILKKVIVLVIMSAFICMMVTPLQVVEAARFTTGTYKATRNLNIREEPLLCGKALGMIKKGTKVKVTKVTNIEWGKVTYKNVTGYIPLAYTAKIKTSTAKKTTSSKSTKSTKTSKKSASFKSTKNTKTSKKSKASKSTKSTKASKKSTASKSAKSTKTSKKSTASKSAKSTKTTKKSTSKSAQKVVYLTFDDGPSKNTPEVLKILKAQNVKATFFVCGIHQAKTYRSCIKDAYKQGHAIGAHSYTHYWSIYKSAKGYYDDLDKIQAVIKAQTGHKTNILRFPGGSSNTVSKRYSTGIMTTLTKSVQKKGYQYFDWNVSSGDAAKKKATVSQIVKNATRTGNKKKVIVLMHDAASKTNTVKALPEIISYYKKKGYTFKTLNKNAFTVHEKVNN